MIADGEFVCLQHGGNPPKTYAEKQEFKKAILAMKVKQDEENFDEAEGQAYRCWSEGKVYRLFPSHHLMLSLIRTSVFYADPIRHIFPLRSPRPFAGIKSQLPPILHSPLCAQNIHCHSATIRPAFIRDASRHAHINRNVRPFAEII